MHWYRPWPPCVRNTTRPSQARLTHRCRVSRLLFLRSTFILCLDLKVISASCICVFVCTSVDVLVSQYTEGLKSPQMLTRCGSALALGCLPKFMIHSKLKQVCWRMCTLFNHFTSSYCLSVYAEAGVGVFVFVCVAVLDPRKPPADVFCQPEGGEFHRSKERCSPSYRSVSIYINPDFI